MLGEKAAHFQVERSKIAYLLAGGGREEVRLLPLGGPHSDQATVSLEMHLVLALKRDMGVFHPLVEVFKGFQQGRSGGKKTLKSAIPPLANG